MRTALSWCLTLLLVLDSVSFPLPLLRTSGGRWMTSLRPHDLPNVSSGLPNVRRRPQSLQMSGGLYLTGKLDTKELLLFSFPQLPFWRQNSKFRRCLLLAVLKAKKKVFFTVVYSLAKGSGVRFLMRHVVPSRANFP